MQYPLYYKRTRLSGNSFIMMASENTAVEVSHFPATNGCNINKSDYYKPEDLDGYKEHGKEISKTEFLDALSVALTNVKFTAHEMVDVIETVKSSLSKVG